MTEILQTTFSKAFLKRKLLYFDSNVNDVFLGVSAGSGILMYFNWSKTTFLATELNTGGWINIKMSSYQYRKSHCGDKTILRPSYLHNGISYTGKMTSLYWIRALNHNGERSLKQRHSTRFNELPTNKNELERIRMNPKRPTTHVRRSLWFAVLNTSQYSLRLHELWRSVQRATIFLPNQNELQRTTTSMAIFVTNRDSMRFAKNRDSVS